MPPFRTGLLKRKIVHEKPPTSTSRNESSQNVSNELEETEDLIRGYLDDDNDSTDAEPEEESDAAVSDQDLDKVMFEDDADSTLGDEEDVEGSEISSELTDSEADDDSDDEGTEDNSSNNSNSEEGDKDEEEDNSEELNSADSGAESGPSLALSSDESEKKKTINIEKDVNKSKKQQKVKQKSQQDTKNSIDVLADKIKESSVSIQPVQQKDEYESGDTSDEEDRRNTVGDVPLWWYNEYPHIGYDLDGRRIIKPPQRDQIDEFLKKCEDPDFWRTVRDPQTGQDVRLSTADLQLIASLREGRLPDDGHDEYKPWVEWFSREVLSTPLRAFPDHKRSFLPSASDRRQVARLVHALKMGWSKTRKQIADERRQRKEKKFYNLWGSGEAEVRGLQRHIPAPRRPPPSHAESYNPPPEYLLDAREMKEWNKLSETPWKRKYTFLPSKFASLRAVPAYPRFLRERFLRCLDLYLAPRAIKMRLTIRPEELVPKLPAPRDLQPFPTAEVLRYRGHRAAVRSVDVDPAGRYVLSGSDDRSLKVWELSTGRCLRTVELDAAVVQVAWGPAEGLSVVAAAVGPRLLLLNPGADIGAHRLAERTDELLAEPPPQHDVTMDARTKAAVQWEEVTPDQWAKGVRLSVKHLQDIIHLSWHARGDYLCSVSRAAGARAVLVHQVSRRRSQLPLARAPGAPQAACFHPTRPLLLLATQRAVRIYDLVKQQLTRKLQAAAQWLSALAVHPAGDNLLAVSYDAKCHWFDLELSSRPYQTLRLHSRAVRAAAFHARYPLFATAGDDRYVLVCHGMVYNDLLQNPLLVPLRRLPGGAPTDGLVTLALRWHPAQPWLLAAGADHHVRLYS